MKLRKWLVIMTVSLTMIVAMVGVNALRIEAAAHGNHCPHGVKSCSASQVGQPCNPNNLSVVCSAQVDGSYCCLAYAP